MSINQSKTQRQKICYDIPCPKLQWLRENCPEVIGRCEEPEEEDMSDDPAVLAASVSLFPNFTAASGKSAAESAASTEELLRADCERIAGAVFLCLDLPCTVDYLEKCADGSYRASIIRPATHIRESLIAGCAFILYTAHQKGMILSQISVYVIDPLYVKEGGLDAERLFRIEDVTERAKKALPIVAVQIKKYQALRMRRTVPDVMLSDECFFPSQCPAFDHCTAAFPHPNVFDVAAMSPKQKLQLFRAGIVSFEKLEHSKKLSDNQQLQVSATLHEEPPYINPDGIREFLDTLYYPLYFLDFESVQPPVPLFDGTHPYEAIPFQYSLHSIENADAELVHREFLAPVGADPRRAIAEQLVCDIPRGACVIAYGMSLEKSVVSELADMFPDLSEHLWDIYDGFHDIVLPFQRRDYYDRAMNGSYSLKHVLPALFPDDPTLNYGNLSVIHNGGEAMRAYLAMQTMEGRDLEKMREALFTYCGLDTFAMVKLWEKLCEVCCSGAARSAE